MRIIRKRKRIFVGCEGESEQSFIKWLQILCDEQGNAVHLDSSVLGGGGFEPMLKTAVYLRNRQRQTRGQYRVCFLVVDEDRAKHGDWSIEKLRREAELERFMVCIQRPNHEAVLLRMMLRLANCAFSAAKFKRLWPDYRKPSDAETLRRRFSIESLREVAEADPNLGALLRQIGLLAIPTRRSHDQT